MWCGALGFEVTFNASLNEEITLCKVKCVRYTLLSTVEGK